MDVDVLHRDLLLALAAMTIESVKQQGVGPGELVSLAKGLTMAFEALFFDHRAPVALHGRIVGTKELSGDHGFELVPGRDARERRHRCVYLPISSFFV